MEEIIVDGSYGEGGGQILRSSLLFSTLLNKPVKVTNIRAKRPNPGLRPQHLATIKAFVKITGGKAEGLKVGSKSITYFPGNKVEDYLRIDVGTAGSITLMLQSLIPALGLKGKEIRLKLMGGTDTKWSPTTEYFRKVVLPFFERVGLSVSMKVIRRGYYPKGGGIVEVVVRGTRRVRSFNATKVKIPEPSIVSICSRLPRSVAERQAKAAKDLLEGSGIKVKEVRILTEGSVSPGTSILVYFVDPSIYNFIGGDCIGEKGLPAEEVGKRAAEAFLKEVGFSIDRHLADMIVPLAAIASGRSEIFTSELTGHLSTNLYIAKLFTGCQYQIRKLERGVIVSIEGRSEIL